MFHQVSKAGHTKRKEDYFGMMLKDKVEAEKKSH